MPRGAPPRFPCSPTSRSSEARSKIWPLRVRWSTCPSCARTSSSTSTRSSRPAQRERMRSCSSWPRSTSAALRSLFAACARIGVEALVEAHDADEVARAVAAGATIIGINHRDLRTFTLDRDLALRLRPTIAPDTIIVGESGLRDASDVRRLGAGGIDAVLVGETLMRAADPARSWVSCWAEARHVAARSRSAGSRRRRTRCWPRRPGLTRWV